MKALYSWMLAFYKVVQMNQNMKSTNESYIAVWCLLINLMLTILYLFIYFYKQLYESCMKLRSILSEEQSAVHHVTNQLSLLTTQHDELRNEQVCIAL